MTTKNSDLRALFDKANAARQELVSALRSESHAMDTSGYTFSEGDQQVSLRDLFGEQKDLIVVHNMGRSCVYCTLWADGLNGLLSHLKSRSAIVLMNGDSVDQQREFAESRNWKFRMISDAEGSFTEAMGFATIANGKRSLMPGYSTFHREEDGTVVRVASDFFGPGDVYMPLFPMFDLLKDGLDGWKAQYSYPKPLSKDLSQG
ncbi:MAG: DUF899 family protein [Candidatus Kapabacteria bacterium]|nr:DUF899 family protein [Candidatus Kapabacteria bacterium]